MSTAASTRTIDPSEPGLADRIVEIQRAAYAVEAALIGFDGIPQLTETAHEVRLLSHLHWIGAFAGNDLVGVIAWEGNDDNRTIDRLAVDPLHARKGLGRRLVRSVPSAAKISVSTGAENAPAIALYEREGYVRVGTTEIAPDIHLAHFERVG